MCWGGHSNSPSQSKRFRIGPLGQEHRRLLHSQGPDHLIEQRTDHAIEIGLRAELPSEGQQRVPIIMALGQEVAFQPGFDPPLQRLK